MAVRNGGGHDVLHPGHEDPLERDCHGQLYVALSRTGNAEGVKVLIVHNARDDAGAFYKRNVVFRDVLLP